MYEKQERARAVCVHASESSEQQPGKTAAIEWLDFESFADPTPRISTEIPGSDYWSLKGLFAGRDPTRPAGRVRQVSQ